MEIMIVDPKNPASIFPELGAVGKTKLKSDIYAKLSSKIVELRRKAQKILSKGGLVVVFLRKYKTVMHKNHHELILGNYDWLWAGAGADNYLHIQPTNVRKLSLTDYGSNCPFGSYLESSLEIEAIAQGKFSSLALADGNMAAFIIEKLNGKIIFLPVYKDSDSRQKLMLALQDSAYREAWPGEQPCSRIECSWLEKYDFPEIELIEKTLDEKEAQIIMLERECEYMHRNFLQIRRLRNMLFGGPVQELSQSVSSLCSQWGIETVLDGDFMQLVSPTRKALVLFAVMEGKAPLWIGKKLERMKAKDQKGILVVNSYRRMDPSRKNRRLYSRSLLQFIERNNIVLTTPYDIFQAHCMGRKDYLDKIWDKKGVVSIKVFDFEAEDQIEPRENFVEFLGEELDEKKFDVESDEEFAEEFQENKTEDENDAAKNEDSYALEEEFEKIEESEKDEEAEESDDEEAEESDDEEAEESDDEEAEESDDEEAEESNDEEAEESDDEEAEESNDEEAEESDDEEAEESNDEEAGESDDEEAEESNDEEAEEPDDEEAEESDDEEAEESNDEEAEESDDEEAEESDDEEAEESDDEEAEESDEGEEPDEADEGGEPEKVEESDEEDNLDKKDKPKAEEFDKEGSDEEKTDESDENIETENISKGSDAENQSDELEEKSKRKKNLRRQIKRKILNLVNTNLKKNNYKNS